MSTLEQHRERWNELYKQWHALHQAYLLASHEERQAFRAAAEGRGTGPSMSQILQVEELYRAANEAQLAKDELIKSVFG